MPAPDQATQSTGETTTGSAIARDALALAPRARTTVASPRKPPAEPWGQVMLLVEGIDREEMLVAHGTEHSFNLTELFYSRARSETSSAASIALPCPPNQHCDAILEQLIEVGDAMVARGIVHLVEQHPGQADVGLNALEDAVSA